MTNKQLIAEAERLVLALNGKLDAVCSDWSAEGRFDRATGVYHSRLCHALLRAERRFERRDA